MWKKYNIDFFLMCFSTCFWHFFHKGVKIELCVTYSGTDRSILKSTS